MKKKHVILSAALIAMLAMSGCGQKADDTPAPKSMTAEEIITASTEAMSGMDSYGFTMNMDMSMDMQEQGTMDMKMVSNAETMTKPQVLVKMESTVDMTIGEENQTMDMTQYIEGTDTGLVMYQGLQGQWFKMVMDDPALVQSMTQDPQEALGLYQDSMEKAEILGEETINERDCYKINMVLTAEAMDEILGSFGDTGLDEETLAATKAIMEGTDGFATVVWIDKENFQMLKQTMDISDIIRQAVTQALASEGVDESTVGDVTMSMEIFYNNYNGITEIVIPEEAKNAPDYTGLM